MKFAYRLLAWGSFMAEEFSEFFNTKVDLVLRSREADFGFCV